MLCFRICWKENLVCLSVCPSVCLPPVCVSVCLFVCVCVYARMCVYLYTYIYIYNIIYIYIYILIYTACCVFLLWVFAWVRTLTRAHQMMELQMHRVRTITCRLADAAPPGSQSNANDHHWYNMQIPHTSRCVGFVCCTNGGQLHPARRCIE
jgi:hypothetical protein